MKLRGALLGCGQVSGHHLRAWAQIDEVEIVALYNRTISKAEQRAREFGISLDHVYNDYNEMLSKEELDFVDVATAPGVHRDHVQASASHGYNILCQKPFAPTIEDAQAMIEACDRAGVVFSINENWRWRAWYQELKRALDSGVLGRIRYFSIVKHRGITLPGPGMTPPQLAAEPNTLEQERLLVYNWGVHLIDLLRFLLGEITSIYAQMDNVSPYFKGEDRAILNCSINQIMGIIDISWASVVAQSDTTNIDTKPENLTIEGDQGSLGLSDQDYYLRVTTGDKTSKRLTYHGSPLEAYQDSYTAAQRHFAECLLSGQTPETEAKDNLKSLTIALAAYKSVAEKQVIFF
jgi:predicted dehydrogenase